MSAAEQVDSPRGLTRSASFTRVALAYLIAFAAAVGTCVLSEEGTQLHATGVLHRFSILAAGDLSATLVIFGFSLLWRNSSVYDPYWSIVPPLFSAGYWALGAETDARSLLHAAIVVLWSARLTFNWIRGWRGLDYEDFRYRDLQKKFGKGALYWLVSFAGLHLFPTMLVLVALLPTAAIYGSGDTGLDLFAVLGALTMLAGIAFELVADRQLHAFARSRTSREAICDVGLWRWSRHPNYFGEILFWTGPLLVALGTGRFVWWMAFGPLSILALFLFASIPMMEGRQRARKPAYAAYQRKTSMLIPLPPRD
jgi:steroid 5-alpha reductase family enzyme